MKGLAGGAGQMWEGDALRIDRSDASLFAADSAAIVPKLAANSPSSVTTTASTRLLAIAAKALSNSLGPCALAASISNFNGVAAACIAGMIGLLTGLFGFDRAAT